MRSTRGMARDQVYDGMCQALQNPTPCLHPLAQANARERQPAATMAMQLSSHRAMTDRPQRGSPSQCARSMIQKAMKSLPGGPQVPTALYLVLLGLQSSCAPEANEQPSPILGTDATTSTSPGQSTISSVPVAPSQTQSTTTSGTSTTTATSSATTTFNSNASTTSNSTSTSTSEVSTTQTSSDVPPASGDTNTTDVLTDVSTEGAPTSDVSSPPTQQGCGAADILCANFEDVATDALPTGAPWLAAPGHCPSAGYEIGVAANGGHDDSKALVSSNSSTSTNACALVADLGSQTDFWVRALVKYMGAGPTNEHEITFFELGEHPDQDDPEARVGFRNDGCNDTDGSPFGGLEFNMTKGPGGEFTGCTGVPLEGNRWYCVEVHVVQTAASASGDLYLDGQRQSFTNHGSPVDQVLANGAFRYLKLGAQTYGGVNTGPLVLDEVTVSTSRVACP